MYFRVSVLPAGSGRLSRVCVNHASLGCDRFSFVNVSLTKRGTEQALAVERAKAHFLKRDKILLTISKTSILLLVDLGRWPVMVGRLQSSLDVGHAARRPM